MRGMKPAIREAYQAALHNARAAKAAGDLDAAFAQLERAHILGQRYLWPHLVTHAHMLRLGWRRRDLREIAGQLLRLGATLPGWLSGWVPKGNTGGANVSALKPMPIPADLLPLLADYRVGRDVAARLLMVLASAVLFAGFTS